MPIGYKHPFRLHLKDAAWAEPVSWVQKQIEMFGEVL